jgi:gluconokinase/6-phosphogluconolactonase
MVLGGPNQSSRKIIVASDAAELARIAADRLVARIIANGGRVAICLSGGSSPKQMFELLTTDAWRNRIPWDRVHWFIGDERFVPATDPRNNMTMARKAFLDRCAPPANVHPIDVDSGSPPEAARRYERELKSFYGADQLDPARPLFDLVLLGVGPDGHTASLFPGYPAESETRRWVTDVPEADVEPFVPRVSLTLPTLASCHEMLLEASGTGKRAILTRVLEDGALVVMGVSGSGKSTVADRLAERIGWTYEDGDKFHPASNVAKMKAGHPLTDEDRWPWLRAIAAEIDRASAAGEHVVIACSALKRAYRDILVHRRSDVRIVFLNGTQQLIADRLAKRKDHFMPPDLLPSQFKTLEPPTPDENPVTVSIDATVEAIVDDIVHKLALATAGNAATSRTSA